MRRAGSWCLMQLRIHDRVWSCCIMLYISYLLFFGAGWRIWRIIGLFCCVACAWVWYLAVRHAAAPDGGFTVSEFRRCFETSKPLILKDRVIRFLWHQFCTKTQRIFKECFYVPMPILCLCILMYYLSIMHHLFHI